MISDAIKTTEGDIPVYFVQNEDETLKYVNYRVEDIQYYLQDRKIQLISREQLKDISGDYFVVACSDEDELLDGHDVVAQAYGMMLMVPERTSLSASFENASHSLLEGMSNSVTGKNVYDNSSKHVEGFVAFCQYLVLEPGEYEVSYSIDVANADEDNIGHLDVCADLGATILYHEEINVKSNAEEKQTYTITYKFRVDETKSDVELRLFSYGNADITLKGIQYQRTIKL